MEAGFWLERWQKGEIGFHLPRPHPLLCRHWSSLAMTPGDAVLVPLCGKSLDMYWLHERGHPVCGVELSAEALVAFARESGLNLQAQGDGFRGDGMELVCADWFQWRAEAPYPLFYDRAALIALPPAMRKDYVAHLLAQLAPAASGLLVTLEYEQAQMAGPPFSVDAAEVAALFAGAAAVQEISRADILDHEPRFRERGLTRLQEVAWHVRLL